MDVLSKQQRCLMLHCITCILCVASRQAAHTHVKTEASVTAALSLLMTDQLGHAACTQDWCLVGAHTAAQGASLQKWRWHF